PEMFQGRRPSGRQGFQAGLLPAGRHRRRRGQESRLQDRQMRLALGAASCLAILIAAPGVQAGQRYAAPNGTGGEPCAQATPCSLKDALTKANAGDEVIVTSGSYTL